MNAILACRKMPRRLVPTMNFEKTYYLESRKTAIIASKSWPFKSIRIMEVLDITYPVSLQLPVALELLKN